jgi:hypothetical protein
VVGDGREALLVHAQGEQQMGHAVGRRQVRLGGAHTEAVHPPPATDDQQRAGLADDPHAQAAGLQREPGAALQLALVGAEQVAEQSLRNGLGPLVAPPLRPRHPRAAVRVQLGDDPGVCRGRQRHRRQQRLEPHHRRPGGQERDRVEQRPRVPEAGPALEPARVGPGPPGDGGELG